jgi:hypothetical protein
MRLHLLIPVVALLLSCGGGEDTVSSSAMAGGTLPDEANREPVITSVTILPHAPGAGRPLSVSLKAYDPEGARLQAEYTWYRNDQLAQRGTSTTLPASETARGDRIRVVATVSDGVHRVSRESGAPVQILNESPRVLSVGLAPKNASAADQVLATPKVVDVDGDPIKFSYRWYVNKRRIPDASGPSLQAGLAQRDDEVMVSVAGDDGYEQGQWHDSPVLRISNSAPQITSQPSYELAEGNVYQYRMSAVDPDEDRPLRFELDEGPAGMRVDLVSGLVSWKVPDDAGGKYPVKVSVSDPHGGRTQQSYVLELNWETVPANTP